MNNSTMHANKQQGFTLIELSIVLVIIGLIVGGILVGQDLIRAAEIRATVSQIEKYNTSVNTFRNKYNYIPGDLLSATAATLGFFQDTTGGVGHQDGDGLLEGGSATAVGTLSVGLGDTVSFFRHLTDAQMIDGNYGTATAGNVLVAGTGAITTALTANNVATIFPPSKLGRGNYVVVSAMNGFNYFQIAGITAMTTGGAYTLTNSITPIEAQNIDAKTDDGLPLNGNVRAMRSTTVLNATSAAADSCSVGATVTTYDVGTTNGSAPNCQVRLRFN